MNDNTTAHKAEEYDEKIIKTIPYYSEFYKQIIDILKVSGKTNISWFDEGCGTGKMSQEARKSILNIDSITSCDISDKMLEIAKTFSSNSNDIFINKSVLEKVFENKFDIVTTVQVNHYFNNSDRIKSIKNCYNALKTGGLYFTFENIAPISDEGVNLFLNRWKSFQINCGKPEEESCQHIARYGKEYFPISISEHLKVLELCGFKAVEVIWVSYMQAGFLGIK